MGPSTSARAASLLRKADELLSGAAGADVPGERFRLSYLAALRGAGAVVAAAELRGFHQPKRRPATRNAWVMMMRADDTFAGWADYFADRSAARAAVEAGVQRVVDAEDASRFYDEVGRFLHDVENYLSAESGTGPRM
ncbi:SAV_6107 family HEPN domain-containing protein [Rhodococcus sp. SMB37]|uniref:SAV_6107 family HEPN domain-containing protein n=1 Tax=Rhodococcus sp. SMB37 TaxID=2512213 RepID=UPI0010516004|nr:SAV_6107 family HEPN domain-containing protein [Rhodococcus sp. SMB37]